MSKLKIFWSKQAVNSVKKIVDYYQERNPSAAQKIKTEIIRSPKTIHFSKQYQLDEISPKYRRIIIRDFKILYLAKNNRIDIIDVISTLQSPNILKQK